MVKRYYTVLIIFILLISCYKTNIKYPFKYHSSEDFFNGSSEFFDQIPGHVNLHYLDENIKPRSGTVSHHLLVSPIINSWFKELKKHNNDIKNFFIISPKHTDLGYGIISLSSLDWRITGNKSVKANKKYINKILNRLNIKEDRYAFHKEHGIGTLIPFINYYYPDARIIPIVMDEFNKQISICGKLSGIISGLMEKDDKSFLIISVDFSHRVNLSKTKKRDAITRDALNSLDPDRVNEIYSDNNVSLFTLFFTCNNLNLDANHIFCNIDSQSYIRKNLDDITSYFFTFQYKKY